MPILKKIALTQVTLPKSGAVCALGFTWGEKNALQKKLYEGMNYDMSDPTNSVKQMDAGMLQSHTLESVVVGLKEWDMTDEQGVPLSIDLDTLSMLESEDGDFLIEQVTKILHPKKEEAEDTERKKG